MLRMCRRYTQDEDKLLTIMNDGFLKVFQKIHLYAQTGSLEGWIRKIMFRALSDYFRKDSRYIQFMVFDEPERPEQGSVLQELYFEDLLAIVEQLPDMSQKVFKLYAIEGYNHREIGEMFGLSENTSKWYLAEARKKLKKIMKTQVSHLYARKRIQ